MGYEKVEYYLKRKKYNSEIKEILWKLQERLYKMS
jgi:hypothetical protein